MQKILIACLLLASLTLTPLVAAKGNIVGVEGCTGSGSCASTRISEDNDHIYYAPVSQENNVDCGGGVVYQNVVIAGSGDMCTGTNNCTGCGGVDKPDTEAIARVFQADEGPIDAELLGVFA